MPKTQAMAPAEAIESRILLIRGHKVILDVELAELYGVENQSADQGCAPQFRAVS